MSVALAFFRPQAACSGRIAIENLIWVGGFDSLGLSRRELLWQAGLWLGPESDPDRTGGRDDHPQTELALDEPYSGLAFPGLDAPDRGTFDALAARQPAAGQRQRVAPA